MRIKHFFGYGCVNAKTIKKVKCDGNLEKRYVEVTGNHERGLSSTYMTNYDVYNWLVKRMFKDIKSHEQVKDFNVKTDYVLIDGIDTEQCIYCITVNVKPN